MWAADFRETAVLSGRARVLVCFFAVFIADWERVSMLGLLPDEFLEMLANRYVLVFGWGLATTRTQVGATKHWRVESQQRSARPLFNRRRTRVSAPHGQRADETMSTTSASAARTRVAIREKALCSGWPWKYWSFRRTCIRGLMTNLLGERDAEKANGAITPGIQHRWRDANTPSLLDTHY
jgi:hypothetical protein